MLRGDARKLCSKRFAFVSGCGDSETTLLLEEIEMKTYYKGAKLDGWDFYTGKTINYRENIGKTVRVPEYMKPARLCTSSVIHASRKPNNIFIGSKIPCSVYKVRGNAVVSDQQKSGFKELKILEEIPQEKLDQLFGWNYLESCNPINPLLISAPVIRNKQLDLLRNWDSVRDYVGDSVRNSVWDYVGDSVRNSVRDYVWVSVWDYVGDSVWVSVMDSVRNFIMDSVGDSVWDFVWAYIGSLFLNIKKWKHIKHKRGTYPFQSGVDLWKMGLVPSFDGILWRLHGGEKAKILWKGKI